MTELEKIKEQLYAQIAAGLGSINAVAYLGIAICEGFLEVIKELKRIADYNEKLIEVTGEPLIKVHYDKEN